MIERIICPVTDIKMDSLQAHSINTNNSTSSLCIKLFSLILMSALMIICVTNNAIAAQASDAAKARIARYLPAQSFGLFTPAYGQRVQRTVKTGQDLILAVNTQGMNTLRNKITFGYGDDKSLTAKSRLVEVRIDPTQQINAVLDAANFAEPIQYIRFTMPTSTVVDISGRLELSMLFSNDEVARDQFKFMAYDLQDVDADSALAINSAQALEVVHINIGYLGNERTDEQVDALIEDYQSRFAYATKGYARLEVNLLGRRSYPANGTELAGSDHDYRAWWASLPHDLQGTSLIPLNPDDAADLLKISEAWYLEHHGQLQADTSALFAEARGRTLVFTESGYFAATGQRMAIAPYYTNYGNFAFKQRINGVYQYGFNSAEYQYLDAFNIQKIALHEFGHIMGLSHPVNQYQPAGALWQAKLNNSVIAMKYNVMTQGNAADTHTQRYYDDAAIRRIVRNVDAQLAEMPIPAVNTVMGNIDSDIANLLGTKQSTAVLTVNGEEQYNEGTATAWQVNMAMNPGLNRFDVSQSIDGVTSQPRPVFVERYQGPALPAQPHTLLSLIHRGRGQVNSLTLNTQGSAGIKAVWWWVYKLENGSRRYISGIGRWTNLHATVSATREYRFSLNEPGQYEICARSRDMLYPVPGEQHQSNVSCTVVDNF
ncbi:MAG: hypothetical protein HRT35_21925 [Algicola sp.]|nr:hypothetical protein [Algicola sp.]